MIELKWRDVGGWQEAVIGEWPIDGVRFSLTHQATCYRRGQWRLLIETCSGAFHHDWGCFDDADQPMRYYHNQEVAKAEANSIANVLMTDRLKHLNPPCFQS